jgi:hypothetical protein
MRDKKINSKWAAAFTASVVAALAGELASAPAADAALTAGTFHLSPVTDSFGGTAGGISPAIVTPGDTFNIAVVGFTNAGSGAFIIPALDPTFGTTQTFTGPSYLGGQNVTVTSSETIGLTTTTDTVTISVPTSFDPDLSLGGSAINQLQVNVGGYNGLTDHIDLLLPIDPTTLTTASSTTYNAGGGATVYNLGPAGDTLFNNNSSIALITGVYVGSTGDASNYNFNSFTLSATYATVVPEPAAIGLIAVSGIAILGRRRRRAC